MFIIRPTASLAARMKIKRSPSELKSSTCLGDWYAMDITMGRRQLILCVSENTRLAVVMKAAPYADFPIRFPLALIEVLKAIGVSDKCIQEELEKMKYCVMGKAINRSITGTLNEYRFQLGGELFEFLLGYSLYLSNTPCIKMQPHWPIQATLEAFLPAR